jgi:hypothetical protein
MKYAIRPSASRACTVDRAREFSLVGVVSGLAGETRRRPLASRDGDRRLRHRAASLSATPAAFRSQLY